jgi:uncharacterized protein (DUF58 family)
VNLTEFRSRFGRFIRMRSPLGRWAEYAWRSEVTPVGRMFLFLLLVSGPVAAFGTRLPLYRFSVFIFSLVFVGIIARILFRPTLRVDRTLPERCAAGVRVFARAKITNTGWLPVFDVGATERRPPPAFEPPPRIPYVDVIRPGETAETTYSLLATRRGVYTFGGAVGVTAFPFGAYNRSRHTPQPHRMLVYPSFRPLAEVTLAVGQKHQPGGLQLVSHVGDSEEFLGNREYRPGDRLRDIHHAAWARIGRPVVREYQQEYLSRVALVTDTWVPRARRWSGGQDLEAALSLAAAVADCLSRREYILDIFAAGPDVFHLMTGRSLGYLENVLDLLACVEPSRDCPFARLTPALMEEISRISSAVVILLDWDESRAEFVRSLQSCGVAVKLLIVRSEPPTMDPAGFQGAEGRARVLRPQEIEKGVDRL